MDAAACARVRAAMDNQFGAAPVETVPNSDTLVGHASQTGSGGFVHGICHPNPAMAAIVDLMPQMTEVHCQVLRSSVEHIRLNGQSFVRTDPYLGDGVVQPHTNPTGMHIDNAFLPSHDVATPREVYSRSIVYLNDVEAGGAPIVVWPRSHHAARDIVEGLLAEKGEARYLLRIIYMRYIHRYLHTNSAYKYRIYIIRSRYHGARWRDEVISAMTRPRADASKPSGYDTKEIHWPGVGPAQEVLMNEGDMVIFEPMSMVRSLLCCGT